MTTTSPDTRQQLHPVQEEIQAAIVKLANLRLHRVVGVPDMDDAQNVINDLRAMAAILDPIIEAVGVYAKEHFGLRKSDLADFTDVIRDAIEGNATFAIEETMRERLEDEAEAAACSRHELRWA